MGQLYLGKTMESTADLDFFGTILLYNSMSFLHLGPNDYTEIDEALEYILKHTCM